MKLQKIGTPKIEIIKNCKDKICGGFKSYEYQGMLYGVIFSLPLEGTLFLKCIGGKTQEEKNYILNNIKKVKITYEEFKKKLLRENKLYVGDTVEKIENFKKFQENGGIRLIDMVNNYGDDFIPKESYEYLPYPWGSLDGVKVQSYLDITEIYDVYSWNLKSEKYTNKEFYSTSEIIDTLEKWKEALERWNNLEERAKMIEEYEKEQGNK